MGLVGPFQGPIHSTLSDGPPCGPEPSGGGPWALPTAKLLTPFQGACQCSANLPASTNEAPDVA
jgi:hypothetical protein